MHNLDILWTHTIAEPFVDYIITGNDAFLSEDEKALVEAYVEEYETKEHVLIVSSEPSVEECKISGETATCYTLAIYRDNADYGYHGLCFDI